MLTSCSKLIVSILNAESRPEWERPISEAREAKRGVVLRPLPNTTTTAVVAGPYISTRELHLHKSPVAAWLQTYGFKIGKAACKTMRIYPPHDGCRIMCLCLTEIVTESWHTFFIKKDLNPSPVVLVWKPDRDGSGLWTEIDLPDSISPIVGGLGSALVCPHHVFVAVLTCFNRRRFNGGLEVMGFLFICLRDSSVSGIGVVSIYQLRPTSNRFHPRNTCTRRREGKYCWSESIVTLFCKGLL
jgi:hypothetical protein